MSWTSIQNLDNDSASYKCTRSTECIDDSITAPPPLK